MPDAIWTAGGLVTLLTALAVPLWRTWVARQMAQTNLAQGESNWLKQQSVDLANARKVVDQLLQLRAQDAEIIAALRLDKALSVEREQRMTQRIARLEEVLIKIKPEYEAWIRSDFGALLQPSKGAT